ncbi:MAG: exosortase V [Sphingobium sp.]
MISEGIASHDPERNRQNGLTVFFRQHWPLVLAFVTLVVPTFVTLSQEVWSRDSGAHAPLVLASATWLFTQCRGRVSAVAERGAALPGTAVLLVSLPLYTFGRAYDFIVLETAGLYLTLLALAYFIWGARALKEASFPLFYLGFLVPPPDWLIAQITAPLRTFVSWVSTSGLHALGFPIEREGITLYIAQYQLLVEDACSGMNSIIGLTAISLFYIYITHRASWRYSAFLMLFILPIAVIANIIRIVTLVLLTYYYGDAVAQGFLHMTAGVVLFALALGLVFLLDMVMMRVIGWWRERTAP